MRINGFAAPKHQVTLEPERHLYFVPGKPHPLPGTTAIISTLGFGFPRTFATDRLEAAQQRGTYVHGCALLRAADDLDVEQVEPEYAGWVQAVVEAYSDLRLRPMLAEEPLYDPVYDYAGQLDFYGFAPTLVRPPGRALIEWKTGDFRGADMQLGAQANLLRANYDDVEPLQCFIVHLNDSGLWWVEHVHEEEGWQDFAAARRLYARRSRAKTETRRTD